MPSDPFKQQDFAEKEDRKLIYSNRAKKGLLELISMTQFRVSFYGIFTLKDELDVANKKTKKIRKQLKIERQER